MKVLIELDRKYLKTLKTNLKHRTEVDLKYKLAKTITMLIKTLLKKLDALLLMVDCSLATREV